MKKGMKYLALLLALLMILAGCAGDSGTATPADDGAAAPGADQAGTDNVDTTGMSPLDILMTYEDKIPLGGLQSSYLESRAHIEKGLPVEKSDSFTIGWCSASQAQSFFVEMVQSAIEAANGYGYEFLWQVADFDLNQQMTQIENYIIQGVDFLVINTIDMDATLNYYEQAVAAGIPVICVGPTSAQQEYPIVTSVVSASFECGWVVGQYAAEALYDEFGDKAIEVAYVLSTAGDADSNSRCCGFTSGYLYKYAELSGNPYDSRWDATIDGYAAWVECRDTGSSEFGDIIKLVGYGAAGSTDTTAMQNVAGDLLTTHPSMNLLFLDTTSRVTQEVEQHGRTPGEDLYICYGGNGEMFIVEDIIEGRVLATGTNSPYYTGAGVINLIHDIVEGYDANNMPATLFTPSYVVSAENAAEIYDPNEEFAPMQEWDYMNIDEYNAANAS